jgi:hypothetical protein
MRPTRILVAVWRVALLSAGAACGGRVDLGPRVIEVILTPDAGGDDATFDSPSNTGSTVDAEAEGMRNTATDDGSLEAPSAPNPAVDGALDAGQEASAIEPDASTCDDDMQDGNETDVDCGGSCPPCSRDQMCLVDADCSATAPSCHAGFGGCKCNALTLLCAYDHCLDAKKDADETDVDCGGKQCAGCGPSKACLADGDCSSSLPGCANCACDNTTMTCVYNHCYDHKLDSTETDLDCGGGTCAGCALGKGCRLDADCTSEACDGMALKCVSNTCADHRQDAMETDVDCGGPVCSACQVGMKCLVNTDCLAGFCTQGVPHVCQ